MTEKARIAFSKDYAIGKIDRRLYASFVEHLGRAVYGGVYQPGHASAGQTASGVT